MKTIRSICFWMVLSFSVLAQESWSNVPLATLKTEARSGDSEAQFELGRCYAEADGGIETVDEEDAFRWYEKAAKKGHAEAQWRVAEACTAGRGTRSDRDIAEKWYRAAAEQGHLEARLHFCKRLMTVFSSGFDEDERAQLLEWCREPAEQGSAAAAWVLGQILLKGRAVEPDPEQACIWLEKARENGYQSSASEMEGVGDTFLKMDQPGLALEWYKKAAANTETPMIGVSRFGGTAWPVVFEKIGDLYRDGNGVEQDKALALRWYLTGVDPDRLRSGLGGLYRKIGELYAEGVGSAPNPRRAQGWLACANEADRRSDNLGKRESMCFTYDLCQRELE